MPQIGSIATIHHHLTMKLDGLIPKEPRIE